MKFVYPKKKKKQMKNTCQFIFEFFRVVFHLFSKSFDAHLNLTGTKTELKIIQTNGSDELEEMLTYSNKIFRPSLL